MHNKKFNLKNVREFISEKANLMNSIDETKAQIRYHEFIKEQKTEKLDLLNASCKHDIVIRLGKEEMNSQDVGLGYCLTCEQKFYIPEEDKKEDHILDLVGIINPIYLTFYDKGKSVLLKRAQRKLINLCLTSDNFSIEEVKAQILEDLVYFTDEFEYRKIIPRKRKRVLSNGK